MSGIAIRTVDLVKRHQERAILDGLSIEIAAGEVVAILGPSGGGKSTLLRCLNGLAPFESGRVEVGELRLEAGRTDSAPAIRRQLGMIFQDFQLFPHLSALDNVVLAPIHVAGRATADARQRGRELLERVGLGERIDHYPRQLSGGQKQRVAIARALAMNPHGLLCDEITSALDPELKHEVLEVVESLRREGMTILLVTHEVGFARRAADRVVVLAEGRIIEDGVPSAVLDSPTHPRTQKFLERILA